jgi:ATP-binding cassette subfamily B protein
VRVVQGVIIGSALTLIVYHSVNSIIKGNQNISDFVLINSYMLQFFTPLSSLGIILNDIYRSFAEVSGMIELMKATSGYKRISGNLIPPSTPTNLTVKDVAFSYITRDRSFLLKDINLSIKAGWKVGIVGHSGSGKTTLGKILSGLYVPEKGEILLNDIRYSSYEHQALKSVVSYTPQQVQIFNDTLRANIMYSNPDASSQELETAIKESQLNEVINGLPYGVDTILGEQGQSLSGGETAYWYSTSHFKTIIHLHIR